MEQDAADMVGIVQVTTWVVTCTVASAGVLKMQCMVGRIRMNCWAKAQFQLSHVISI